MITQDERARFNAWYKENYFTVFDLNAENNPAMLLHMVGLLRAWEARSEYVATPLTTE